MTIFKQKRPPFPLSEEQVIREALKTVTDYANSHPEDRFDINQCMSETLASVKKIWLKARNISEFQTLCQEDLNEIASLTEKVRTELLARAYDKANGCLKNRKILQINMTTAEALITHALRQNGLKHFYVWQKYRVRVSIKMDNGKVLTAFIKYKDIQEGKLPGIMETIVQAVNIHNNAGIPMIVWEMNGNWKNWEGWKE